MAVLSHIKSIVRQTFCIKNLLDNGGQSLCRIDVASTTVQVCADENFPFEGKRTRMN